MFKNNSVLLIVIICSLSCSNSWVFNNVNFSELATRNLVEGDLENELSAEELVAMQKFSLLYPGTKWCGAGNSADDYEDLGTSKDTDKCCREHDNCPDVLEAGEEKHNLTNTAIYSRLSCTCDEKFRTCLRAVGSKTSNIIGKMYFNALGTKCFREDYPATGCKKKGGWFNTKCIEYFYDTEGEPYFQWFDLPSF